MPRIRSRPDAGAPALALPERLFFVEGREGNVYFDNLIAGSADSYHWSLSRSAPGSHEQERWTWTPSRADAGTVSLAIFEKDTGVQLASSTTAYVSAASDAGAALTQKVLCIGDSLTAAGVFTREIRDIASGDVLNIELVGTRGSADNLHEGRDGWTIRAYCDGAQGSPFVAGGAIDFAAYLDRNGLAPPDWVFILLGTNDCFSQTSDEGAVALAQASFDLLDTLMASILAVGPGTQVGLLTPPPPSRSQDGFGARYGTFPTRWRFKRNITLWSHALIDRYGNKSTERIHVVPTHLALDAVNNFPLGEPRPANSRARVLISRPCDGVHLAPAGYHQIADAVWAFLKASARPPVLSK